MTGRGDGTRKFGIAAIPNFRVPSPSVAHWALLAALGLGAGLRWRSLAIGFFGDDYLQRAQLAGRYVMARAPWDLFWFGPRDAAEHARLVDFGFLPWWSAPDLRVSMWRPLASALMWLDAAMFGADPWPAHLHSMLWWALLVVAASRLYGRLLSTGAAVAATFLFALDEAHNIPVSWLANRSTLVAAALGCFALDAHLAARERGERSALWLAALCWTLALAAGEYGFGIAAYAVAYELSRGRRLPALRVGSLLALGLPVALFLMSRAASGHAVHASGLYVEPTDPRFLSVLPGRALAELSELGLGLNASWTLSSPPAVDAFLMALYERGWLSPSMWQALPDWSTVQSVLGVCALALLAWTVRALRSHAQLGWLLFGSVLAVIASGGALPSARLLVSAELGVAAVLGAALATLATHVRSAMRRPGTASFALAALAAIGIVHLALPARATVVELEGRFDRAVSTRHRAFALPLPVDPHELDVVLVGATDFGTEVMLPWIRQLHGASVPRRWQRLSGAQHAHDLRRLDAHTLELTVLSVQLSGAFTGSLYRPTTQPIAIGQRFTGGGFEVTVRETRDGNPARFEVRFERALDDERLVLLHAFDDGVRRFRVPEVGKTLRLPVASQPWAVR